MIALMQQPFFMMFLGPMFSAKTSRLLMELERLKYMKKRVVVFKPSIDSRYSADAVVTHSGWAVPANIVESGQDILAHLNAIDDVVDVVAVDEAFMIDDVSSVLIWLFKNGVSILVSTLDMSSSCKPFKETERMMPWATHVEKCTAICTVCSCPAHYTYKKVADDDEIQVGGVEMYEPRCWSCHPTLREK